MHILVVEDNPDLVANLYDYLEAKGHSVDAAYDGAAGLRFARDNPYDAIVLDLMLPGMDGLDVCARLRDSGVATPVLMLTARDTLDDKLKGFRRGADDYLVKPFALQELEARLTALVRRARGEHVRDQLQVADLIYDLHTYRVTRAGREIKLPPIPLKMLALLMQRSPNVVSRRELERSIWGDARPDSDTLRTHLHTLRAAIDKPFDQPLLHTLHGVGYRLAEDDAVQT